MRRMWIHQDQLDYVGLLTAPLFHLFRDTTSIASGMYYAFLGLHSGADAITLEDDQNQLSRVVSASLGNWGTWRLSLERIDWTFPNPWAWELDSAVLGRGDAWLRTNVRGPLFRSHYFTYTAHLFPEEGTAHEVLAALGTPTLQNFGESFGTGAIFHTFLAPRQWTAQITLDHSQQVTGGVFFQMIIAMDQDALDYNQIGRDLLGVLHQALAATGLNVVTGVG